jgi:hypothetical protein
MRYGLSVVSALMLIITSGVPVNPQLLEESVRFVARSFHEAISRGDSTTALAILHLEVLVFEEGRSDLEQFGGERARPRAK